MSASGPLGPLVLYIILCHTHIRGLIPNWAEDFQLGLIQLINLQISFLDVAKFVVCCTCDWHLRVKSRLDCFCGLKSLIERLIKE